MIIARRRGNPRLDGRRRDAYEYRTPSAGSPHAFHLRTRGAFFARVALGFSRPDKQCLEPLRRGPRKFELRGPRRSLRTLSMGRARWRPPDVGRAHLFTDVYRCHVSSPGIGHASTPGRTRPFHLHEAVRTKSSRATRSSWWASSSMDRRNLRVGRSNRSGRATATCRRRGGQQSLHGSA